MAFQVSALSYIGTIIPEKEDRMKLKEVIILIMKTFEDRKVFIFATSYNTEYGRSIYTLRDRRRSAGRSGDYGGLY
jgi:hypothetical protein